MISLVQPTLEELSFRAELLKDQATMAYNKQWGGTIDFDRSRWQAWYEKWIGKEDPHYFYRYVYDDQLNAYVGEVAFHYDAKTDRYLLDVIIHAAYRHRGYGGQALELLCDAALSRDIQVVYDDIAAGNPSFMMFLKHGFTIEKQTSEIVTVSKILYLL